RSRPARGRPGAWYRYTWRRGISVRTRSSQRTDEPVASATPPDTFQSMATTRALHISSPGGDFTLVTRERSAPGRGQVEIKVRACGVCHSDSIVKDGQFPGLQLPRVPGHEVVGTISAVGPDVEPWAVGER